MTTVTKALVGSLSLDVMIGCHWQSICIKRLNESYGCRLLLSSLVGTQFPDWVLSRYQIGPKNFLHLTVQRGPRRSKTMCKNPDKPQTLETYCPVFGLFILSFYECFYRSLWSCTLP
jgi:hypothetical protein